MPIISGRAPGATKPPNLPLFYVLAGAFLALIVVLLAVFPNIWGTPLILALTVLTPLVGGGSFALGRSGLRRLLPRRYANTLRVAVAVVVAADLYVLVLPLLIAGPTRHDALPTFVATRTAAVATQTAGPQPTSMPTPLVLMGAFVSGGQGDFAAGKATVGVTTTGTLELALTNFSASNGPDVYVYLSREASPTTSAQVMNGYEVGKLTATAGDLRYTLPASLDLRQYRSVVVYCKSFSIIFGYANLS
jgi:hypothetical protein